MRIVVVNDYLCLSGGQARIAFDCAVGAARLGHEVHAFGAVGPVWPGLKEAGVDTVLIDQPDILSNPNRFDALVTGIWNRRAMRALDDLLRRFDPADTLIHFHGWAKALSPAIGRVLEAHGFRVAYTHHEYFNVCPNGALFDFSADRNCPLTGGSPACVRTNCDSRNYGHKLWRVARHKVMDSIVGLVDRFDANIYYSELAGSILRDRLPAARNWRYVPNRVGIDKGEPKSGPPGDEFLFVGRLSREKAPLHLAEAARRAGAKAVFVGDGHVKDVLVRDYPECEITGWLPQEAVYARIRRARALVFPSVWYETFGLSAYEALALGTPLIVSDNCCASEAVRSGRNGLLFGSGSVESLEQAIRTLMDDETVGRMSAAAFDLYWQNPYTAERQLSALMEVYEDLLETAPEGRAAPVGPCAVAGA